MTKNIEKNSTQNMHEEAYKYTFASDHIQPLLDGEKRCTWRIDDGRNPSPKDVLLLQNQKGEIFAESIVKWVKYTTLGRLTDEDRKYHRSYGNKAEMVETLNQYYPDKDLNLLSEVKVIRFTKARAYPWEDD